ncbi:hypothetical protein ACFQH3_19915 [Haladaptatus sp. GCM10025707]|uniref:AMP-binding enzyme n=1 Tax=Haladaptatus sp. GCM10025707 TaxID=3252658 RepID=UPI00361F5231
MQEGHRHHLCGLSDWTSRDRRGACDALGSRGCGCYWRSRRRPGEVPKAFVVLSTGFEPTEQLKELLRNDVRNRLAEYEYPREIEFVDELPKTSSGKIRRATLAEREDNN